MQFFFLSVVIFFCSVVVFLVGASSLENDIAWQTVLDSEAELRLVEHVFLRSKVDLDGAWKVLPFKLILWHRGHYKALWHFT